MKKIALLFVVPAVFSAFGCQADGNAARTLSPAVQQKQAKFQSMYQAVGGDWSKLSSSEQTGFAAEFTNGNVGSAEILWKEMGQSDFPTQTKAKPRRNQ